MSQLLIWQDSGGEQFEFGATLTEIVLLGFLRKKLNFFWEPFSQKIIFIVYGGWEMVQPKFKRTTALL